MIGTLKLYIARDLLRATLLAALALTVVMTILAVLEPLHEQGLSGRQVLLLFGYLVPAMFSFTLPFAALFGTTIVYGRFAQDNELMACRASGISTLSILRPAMWLAVGVSAVTVLLVTHVAPSLLGGLERTLKANFRQIAFHHLQSQQFYKVGGWIFHADGADAETGWIAGGVAAEEGRRGDVRYVVAASAQLEFAQYGGRPVITLYPTNPVYFQRSGQEFGLPEQYGFRSKEMPSFRDEPRFYGWDQLTQTWKHPAESPTVAAEVRRIRQAIATDEFCRDLARRIGAAGRVELFEPAASRPDAPVQRTEILADRAEVTDGPAVLVGPPAPSDPDKPDRKVVVREYAGPTLQREHLAHQARIQVYPEVQTGRAMVGVTLVDVLSRSPGAPGPPPPSRLEYSVGGFVVPEEFVAGAERVELEEMRAGAEAGRFSPGVGAMVKGLYPTAGESEPGVIGRLKRKVRAEVHVRLAYGASCLALVLLGGALGLMFRGGQFLAALAIVAVPGSFVGVMLYMGRVLIRNPGVPEIYGLAAIWGAVAILAVGAAYVYAVPMRR